MLYLTLSILHILSYSLHLIMNRRHSPPLTQDAKLPRLQGAKMQRYFCTHKRRDRQRDRWASWAAVSAKKKYQVLIIARNEFTKKKKPGFKVLMIGPLSPLQIICWYVVLIRVECFMIFKTSSKFKNKNCFFMDMHQVLRMSENVETRWRSSYAKLRLKLMLKLEL